MKLQNATPAPPNPTHSCFAFTGAIGTGDLELASACLARDGCMVTPDGTAIHGRGAIRAVLAQMIDRRTAIEVELTSTIDAGEVALASQRWKIRSGETVERRFAQSTTAVLVLRLVEGSWKIALLAPWGSRHLLP
ncbi:MAG TPA: nuclear transport factor 2 family protein [Solirubrobacterales bacterium]|nr:nuclear transport factor 2 family protein [Solirubrobacterales bacterium]